MWSAIQYRDMQFGSEDLCLHPLLNFLRYVDVMWNFCFDSSIFFCQLHKYAILLPFVLGMCFRKYFVYIGTILDFSCFLVQVLVVWFHHNLKFKSFLFGTDGIISHSIVVL